MSECTHNCETCSLNCGSAGQSEPKDLHEKPNELSKIKKVIAVVSGKGGVGKSSITSMLTVLMQRKGYSTAILDADITGPSIPRSFGIKGRATGSEMGIFPITSKLGTQVMSINLLLENATDPVVWRGPVIAGVVTQFWTDVIWKDVDFMFVDMPPGTGDVPLTVFQSLPVDGIIIVASPQELVSMIVEKAVKMAGMLNIPILGIVENMSYFTCPNCNEKHSVFGESHIEELAEKYSIKEISKLPINNKISAACDAGLIELFEGDWLDNIADSLEKLI
ncbi:MAG: Mrp/NBP35 family ATP-binding protein [Ruminococcaceae bacterium]|nr:Mrp/NBP35 family ATP-binding protein [Oscillospiraceae bacterium]